MSEKEKIISDIEQLLNGYDGVEATQIDSKLLEFMDMESLKGVVESLLTQIENVNKDNLEWLEQFKN